MIAFLARRLIHAAATWIVAVALIFLAMRVLPGNPLLTQFGQHPDMAKIEELKKENGWDRPLVYQLGEFFYRFFTTGDLGVSIARGRTEVTADLAYCIPATIELTLAAVLIAVPLGLFAGVVSARWQGKLPDHLLSTLSLIGVSLPVFFIGILLWQIFPTLPTSGRLPAAVDVDSVTGILLIDVLLLRRFDLFPIVLRHLFLPALTLSLIPMASIAKISRGAMVETLKADYIRTALAKGASRWRTVLRHALPNAAVPIANIAGLQVGLLLTGAVLTETVFAWPGLGKYIADAVVNNRDYAVVQAGAIVIAAVFAILNLLLDVVYMFLDPRIRIDEK